jgi:hypothetical protein
VAQPRLLSRTRAGCVTSRGHNAQRTPQAQGHATTTLPSTTADAIPLGRQWWVYDFAAVACVLWWVYGGSSRGHRGRRGRPRRRRHAEQRPGGRKGLTGPSRKGTLPNRGAAGKRGRAQTRRRGKPQDGQLQHSRPVLGTDNATATSYRAQPRTLASQRLYRLLLRARFRGSAVPGTGWGTAPCLPPHGGVRRSPAPVSPRIRAHRLRFTARSRYGVGEGRAALGAGLGFLALGSPGGARHPNGVGSWLVLLPRRRVADVCCSPRAWPTWRPPSGHPSCAIRC